MKKFIFLLLIVSLQFIYAKDATILFLGDSLTEGLGVNKEQSYPALVENLIQTKLGKNVKVINGGVSGSTTNDGLDRLKWYVKQKPSLVFVALGANDGLRGLDLEKSRQNLEAIIRYAQNSGAKVLLAGMQIPPNYGRDYAQRFKKMYEDIEQKYDIQTMPFLLEGVAGKSELNQSDGIHPNAKGYEIMAKNIFEFIKDAL
jgi:acyl-CoA thioesterase-1